MIHTAYFYGDDQPATELGPRQLQAARRDPASVLWVDLDQSLPDEERRVLAALGGTPVWATVAEPPAADAPGRRAPGTRERAPASAANAAVAQGIAVWLDGSLLVTRHELPSPTLRRMAERLEPLGGTIPGGAPVALAMLGEALADGHEAVLAATDALSGGRGAAQRAGEVERGAAGAAAVLREAAERTAHRPGGAGVASSAGRTGIEALQAAAERLETVARAAAEAAAEAAGAAATAGLAAAVADAARQLRRTQLIMLAALGLLAVIAYLLWQIAGALG
jgi:hypothetical protein